jgi:deoxycytidylate deaminase
MSNKKSQQYLSQCLEAASKSNMCFKLGAILVKGGKVIATGFNHQRPHYDGPGMHGHRTPVVSSITLNPKQATDANGCRPLLIHQSMHAEQAAITNLLGMTPSFKAQASKSAPCVQVGLAHAHASKPGKEAHAQLSPQKSATAAIQSLSQCGDTSPSHPSAVRWAPCTV